MAIEHSFLLYSFIDKIENAISSSDPIKLISSNYSIWKSKIEDILYYKELH